MQETIISDRLLYLAKQFDIFELDLVESKVNELRLNGFFPTYLKNPYNDELIAILSEKKENAKEIKILSIPSNIFGLMHDADPTHNKMYLQWMLNLINRYLKSENQDEVKIGIRFISDDLPQAKSYLILFEQNKRKQKFKKIVKNTLTLKDINDPTDINQYKSLAQLFDAVDPFVEREPSAVERTMAKYVDMGQAVIPYKDRHFTLFIPKTTDANVIFNSFANWCTAKERNSNFKSYTENYKKPNGDKSDIYIIINNDFFKGKSDEIYQLHIETNQIKDRKNDQNVSIFEPVLTKSEGLRLFFRNELMPMAKDFIGDVKNNHYLDFLIAFGYPEALFEIFKPETPSIKLVNKVIPILPDISQFQNLDQLIISDCSLGEIHPSIGDLTGLELLILSKNKLKTLPSQIGNLTKLTFLNINENNLIDIPNEIANLDKSNGGSLQRLCIDHTIKAHLKTKLKQLLPQTEIVDGMDSK